MLTTSTYKSVTTFIGDAILSLSKFKIENVWKTKPIAIMAFCFKTMFLKAETFSEIQFSIDME